MKRVLWVLALAICIALYPRRQPERDRAADERHAVHDSEHEWPPSPLRNSER